MKQVVIENPIINSPFKEPDRHFRFTEEGITDEIVETRRISAYFIPIARPKKKGKQMQLSFDTEWTQDRVQENEQINKIRSRVSLWNYNLGFTIPYTINGEEKGYYPDFIVQINSSPPLNLIIEVTGEQKKDKATKTATARTLWVPAVSNHGGFGRWAFLEITDPWDAKNLIRGFLEKLKEHSYDQR